MRRWSAVLLAILAVQLQANVFAVWPIAGGVPHLIALGSVPYALLGATRSGVLWVIVGAGLLDLLAPVRFGITLIPTLIGFALTRLLARHVVNTPTWWSIAGVSLLVVAVAELGLVLMTQDWLQYFRDLRAALFLVLPMGFLVDQVIGGRHSGLRLR